MNVGNQELFRYIEKRAKYNIKNKKFFRNTDILQEAFLISEEKAYEILKDIMSRKNIKNTKEAIVDEYLNMLGNGYSSLKEQVELFGGNKFPTIKEEAELRAKDFTEGSIIDIFKEIFNIDEEDIPEILIKYMESLKAKEFQFKVNLETYYQFLENDLEELDKQAKRYSL